MHSNEIYELIPDNKKVLQASGVSEELLIDEIEPICAGQKSQNDNNDRRDDDFCIQQENVRSPADNMLAAYISRYICRYEQIPERAIRKYLRNGLKIPGFVLGATAGLPWLSTSMQAAGDNMWFGYLNSTCMYLSYGVTATWMFLEIIDSLRPLPPETYKIREDRSKILSICVHLGSHFFGITSSIPAAFIAAKYNKSNIYYTLLATLIAYTFNTVGLYKLFDFVIIPSIQKITNRGTPVRKIKVDLGKFVEIELANDFAKNSFFTNASSGNYRSEWLSWKWVCYR